MLSSELRDKVFEFVESSITINQLEEWLVPRLSWFLRDPNSTDADVVAAIELGLSETSSNIKTIEEFRDDLRRVLRENNTIQVFYPAGMRVETSSSNRTDVSFPLIYTSNQYMIESIEVWQT